MTPKISVLVPMYNRKNYSEQCIDSVLNQTFQDFELIIRDDASTDGVFEFVAQKYSAQISSGKIKLRRNEKNLGEHHTENRLFLEATGKYFSVLHNDDMYLPYALERLYKIAENFSADVVHSCSFLKSPIDGVISPNATLRLICADRRPVQKNEVVSDNPEHRFNEYFRGDTFLDTQYNLLKLISDRIELSRYLNKRLQEIDFFKNKPLLQNQLRLHAEKIQDDFYLKRRGIQNKKFSPELHNAVENVFRKYFGDDFFYPMFLFYSSHNIDMVPNNQ